MGYKDWLQRHSTLAAVGSGSGSLCGFIAAKLIGHWWFTGLFVAGIVAIIMATLIPYATWFFAADGRKAQQSISVKGL